MVAAVVVVLELCTALPAVVVVCGLVITTENVVLTVAGVPAVR